MLGSNLLCSFERKEEGCELTTGDLSLDTWTISTVADTYGHVDSDKGKSNHSGGISPFGAMGLN